MLKKSFILLAFVLLGVAAYTQGGSADSLIVAPTDVSVIDTSIDYDELFRDFDAFMDSILTPKSYFLSSLSIARGNYNFESKSNILITSSKKLSY